MAYTTAVILDPSQRSQTGCLPYFHTWCGLCANLECRSEMYCTRLVENTGPKNRQKLAIWAPSHNFVGLYLRNKGTYRQSEKNLLNSISSTCPYNMVNFGPLAVEIRWQVLGTSTNFNGFRVLAALLHGTLVLSVSQILWRWTAGITYIRQDDCTTLHYTVHL